MKYYKVKERLDELKSYQEWLQFAETPKGTVLETLSGQQPLDSYFKTKIDTLILKEISRIENSEVDYI